MVPDGHQLESESKTGIRSKTKKLIYLLTYFFAHFQFRLSLLLDSFLTS